MGAHITNEGQFQSDKYPTCPAGKVPLSVKDPAAQDLLWEYAQRHRPVDAEFSEDLETALRRTGYEGASHTTESLVQRIVDLAHRPDGPALVALLADVRMVINGRNGALAAANKLIGESADEAKKLQNRIDALEAQRDADELGAAFDAAERT